MTERVVEIARRWIGTPYVHQASCAGAGADCLGLVRGVWRELVGAEPMAMPAYTADWSEPQGEERLWQGASAFLHARTVGVCEPGDILLFRIRERSVAKHLGIVGRVGPQPSFIHAYSGHGVVETTLSAPWSRRVVARFAFPGGLV